MRTAEKSGSEFVKPEISAKEEKNTADKSGGAGFGRQLYTHLMNGVTNMLPFTASGGIFIAIAFLIDTLGGAPQDSDFGTHLAAAAWFKTIGSIAFDLMIPIFAGFISKSIAGRPGFLAGFAGGVIASVGSTFSDVSGGVSSGFFGALLAGFAGGAIMLLIEKLCEHMPKTFDGIKPVLIYPLGGLAVIAVLMCAVNPFVAMLNTALSELLTSMGDSSKALLGCIVGAMMAIDMGGPFNKAAYVFALTAMSSENYTVMASVMLGGMVPPLSVALATLFFRNRWTEQELRNGPVNFILGMSFTTEGVIPYAAADPLRVIPSCMAGAAVAGGISMASDCTMRAPHGGIFVFAVAGHPLMYTVSLAAGALTGMILLAILKKKRTDTDKS